MNPAALPDPAFWRDRRVVLTGHTGFKGGWLAIWLHALEAQVTGLSLAPDTSPNLFGGAGIEKLLVHEVGDVRDRSVVDEVLDTARPEVVFHLAAQPLVSVGFDDPIATFSTNVMGTAHVLEAARRLNTVRSVVVVTSDKVYRSQPGADPVTEESPLGGVEPYGSSKAAAEMVVEGYRGAFFGARDTAVSTVRAGNVLGGGDWGRDRLIPDAVRAWGSGLPLALRHPDAVRPWQHVLEPLCAYLRIAQEQYESPGVAGAFNVGPATSHSVGRVIDLARAVPVGWPVEPGVCADATPADFAEAEVLKIDSDRAAARFGISPRWDLQEAVRRTVEWYGSYLDGADARELCMADIASFSEWPAS